MLKFKLMFVLVGVLSTGETFSLGNHGFFSSEEEADTKVANGEVNLPGGCGYKVEPVKVPLAEGEEAPPAAAKKSTPPPAQKKAPAPKPAANTPPADKAGDGSQQ